MLAVIELVMRYSCTFLITTIVSGITWFYWNNRKILAEANKLPTGYRAIPLFGHTYHLIKGSVGMLAVIEIVMRYSCTFLITTIVSGITWFYWNNRKILAEAHKLPTGHRAIPLLGHTYHLLKGSVGMTNDLIRLAQKTAAQSITTIVFWAGPCPLFVISDPRDIQTLFNSTKSLDGGHERYMMKYAFGNSLPFAPAFLWKKRRRAMNLMFHPRNLTYLVPNLNIYGHDLSLSLSRHVGRGQADIERDIYPFSLKSVCALIFGPDVMIQTDDEAFKKLMQAIESISSLATVRFFKIWLWPEFMFRTFYKKEVNEIIASGRNFFEAHLKLAKQENKLQEPEKNDHEINERKGITRNLTIWDMYNFLQEASPGYDEEDLYYEVVGSVAAGSETLKIVIPSCLLALAANPDIQERLYAEIVSVVGKDESDVTLENLNSMPFLEQVLKETLRKFIITPIISRITQDTLKLGSCTLPPGATVCVPKFAVHLNPKYYPDPERFDPERFSPENSAKRSSYCFLPFSAGPRNCIGKNYAMMALKILLVHVIRKLKFSTSANIDYVGYVPGPVTRRVGGYTMSVEHRY